MNRFFVTIAAALLGTVVACSSLEPSRPTQRTLLVQHHAEECMGPWHQLCLLVKLPQEQQMTRHYGEIAGFGFEWGYTYEIEVQDHRVANPPADGSSVRTVLQKVVSRQRVPTGTEFEMLLTGGEGRVEEVTPNHYRFYNAAEFTCPAGASCDELRSRISAGERIKYRFRHSAAPEFPLTVVQWEVCDRALAGSRLCTS